MYDISLIVTIVFDSLGKSVSIRFLVAPSDHSNSTSRQMNLLKLSRTGCCNPSSIQLWSVMTNESSTLVKVASNMNGDHHCVCSFHINQLAVRVSSQKICFFFD